MSTQTEFSADQIKAAQLLEATGFAYQTWQSLLVTNLPVINKYLASLK